MTEPLNGLRFDIYERVHLPDDVAAIEELEEIELVPHMQAQTQDDHVLLRGHLLLSGVYKPLEQDSGASQLEHWIPVEITLPQNRVQRVEDLAVEIDNFDVDLLSTRSLNVTGVLALRGLQAEPNNIPVWRDDSFTVVHQAGDDHESLERFSPEDDRQFAQAESPDETAPVPEAASPAEPDDAEDAYGAPANVPYYAAPEGKEAVIWPYVYPPKTEPAYETVKPVPYSTLPTREAVEAEYDYLPAVADAGPEIQPEPSLPDSGSEWQSDIGWGDLSERKPPSDHAAQQPGIGNQPFAAPYEIPQEEKPEMKVALGVNPVEAPVRVPSGVGLLSQLGEKGAIREAELQAVRSAQEAEAAETKQVRSSTGDELEWTKLFLGNGTESQSFRRVKMCIVQREDTLESIAARYNVQAREIQIRNRLNDPYLSEGQVLYIP